MRSTVFAIFVLVLCSCAKEVAPVSDVIGWSVDAPAQSDLQGAKSRALVEDYSNLKEACTQSPSHDALKIGLFGSCTSDGVREEVFNDVDLWWWAKEDGNPYGDNEGNASNWNYAGGNRNWKDGAHYTFKAYFPKGEVGLHPSSDAESLMVMYDAAYEQYDLLVAHKSIPSRKENPVVLQMVHPLSALRFDFTIMEEGGEDRLLACWLENFSQEGLHMSSTLNFSSSMVWPQSTPIGEGVQMYFWRPDEPVVLGSSYSAPAYSQKAGEQKGALYTGNGGWILLIPQQCKGPEHVRFCFITERGEGKVYSVGLPAGEFKPGYRYSYNVKVSSARPEISVKVSDWNRRKSSYGVDF